MEVHRRVRHLTILEMIDERRVETRRREAMTVKIEGEKEEADQGLAIVRKAIHVIGINKQ